MKKHRVVFRADGGTSIGMGHVVRSLALADMLRNDFEIAFAIQETDQIIIKLILDVTRDIKFLPQSTDFSADAARFSDHITTGDIVVLDGYNFKTNYQESIKAKGCKLVAIDDIHAWHHLADAIINHSDDVKISNYSAEPGTKFFFGLKYVLLRKDFLNSSGIRKSTKSISKVFISMGAGDVSNVTQKFCEALIEISGIKEIHLMLSSVNPNLKKIEELVKRSEKVNIISHFNISATKLKELLQECDVSICPASSIALECCSTGIGLISGYTAENQLGILKSLNKYNAAIDFGNLNQLSVEDIKIRFDKVVKECEVLNNLIENQKKMIDGKSPERLLNAFKQLTLEKLHFRFAGEQDVDLYFKWANDPLVRSNSYNQSTINYQDHVKWFQLKLNSHDSKLYLFLDDKDIPVGQVRIDKTQNETLIGISIDEHFRGRSLGSEMLNDAISDYLQNNLGSNIKAYIKKENVASYNIFLKAGFIEEEIVNIHGSESYKMSKQ